MEGWLGCCRFGGRVVSVGPFQIVIVHAVSNFWCDGEANAADAMRDSGSRNTK